MKQSWIQNAIKNRFQEALENWSILGSIFNLFWLRFGGQVGAMLATFLGPRPPKPKRPPRPLQDGPRCLQRRFGSPKTAQEASKPALELARPRFWMIFDQFLIHVWLIFGWFLIHFLLIFYYVEKTSVSTSKNKTIRAQNIKRLTPKRGGGYAALLRVGYLWIYL